MDQSEVKKWRVTFNRNMKDRRFIPDAVRKFEIIVTVEAADSDDAIRQAKVAVAYWEEYDIGVVELQAGEALSNGVES